MKDNRIVEICGPCFLSATGGHSNKTQFPNTIKSTSFALKFRSNKLIDDDRILYIDMIRMITYRIT